MQMYFVLNWLLKIKFSFHLINNMASSSDTVIRQRLKQTSKQPGIYIYIFSELIANEKAVMGLLMLGPISSEQIGFYEQYTNVGIKQ